MTIVQKQRTALDDETAVQALDDAYLAVTGRRPSPAVLALMAAQTDVETASFQDMYCFNWGGNKAAPGFPLVFQSQTKEMGPDGTLITVHPPDPRCNFQAFTSPAEGAKEYVRRLMRRQAWWNGLHSESVDGFVDGLATRPVYMTADPATYKAALRSRLDRLLPLFESRIAVGWVPPEGFKSSPPPPAKG